MSNGQKFYSSEIDMPEYVYHGTVFSTLDSFKDELITDNDRYYRNNRDFGRAFYTTTDLEQAQAWGKQKADLKSYNLTEKPMVLKIRVNSIKLEKLDPTFKVFLSSTIPWAQFIYDNRVKNIDHESIPDILVGPMADNKIADVVSDFQRNERTIQQFRDTITRRPSGTIISDKDLGNQIAFRNREIAKEILELVGYHVFDNRRWHYIDL